MSNEEIEKAHDGCDIELMCEEHPHLRWSCKRISLNRDENGYWRWNGQKHVFFKGWDNADYNSVECSCSASLLLAVVEEDA